MHTHSLADHTLLQFHAFLFIHTQTNKNLFYDTVQIGITFIVVWYGTAEKNVDHPWMKPDVGQAYPLP